MLIQHISYDTRCRNRFREDRWGASYFRCGRLAPSQWFGPGLKLEYLTPCLKATSTDWVVRSPFGDIYSYLAGYTFSKAYLAEIVESRRLEAEKCIENNGLDNFEDRACFYSRGLNN